MSIDMQTKYVDPPVDEEYLDQDELSTDGPDENEVEAEVGRLIQDAIDYQTDLAENRSQATDYYFGRPFGDEEAGRSQIVSTDVKDTVDGMMPSLMRTFFGPRDIVVFEPGNKGDVETAKQATKYVQHVITKDNNGILEIHSAFKDTLVRRFGVVKWYWDDTVDHETYEFTGITEDQLLMLEVDEQIEYEVIGQYEYVDPGEMLAYQKAKQEFDMIIEQTGTIPGDAPQAPQATVLFDVEVTYYNEDGVARIAAVPPEEWLMSKGARNATEATLVGQRQDKTESDLRVLGVPDEIIQEIKTSSGGTAVTSELMSTPDRIARGLNSDIDVPDTGGTGNNMYPYYEVYVYVADQPGGVTRHRKMVLVGNNMKLVSSEPASERPFAVFECDPEPHTSVGMSVADRTMDLQLSKSKMLRGAHDSLAFSLHPRMVAVEGQASIADLLNSEIGAIIRERAPGMVREIGHTFNGHQALPFLEYFDTMRENRTGQSKAAAGLDPDSLQSSTKAAVSATVAGSQQRLELYARLLAETGMKTLMRGLLRLVTQHQQAKRTVRLDGEFVEVDPRMWDAGMKATVNVAVGYTVDDERMQKLQGIAAKQEQILAQMGPNNPVVTLGQYVQTLHEIARLSGEEDTTRYFNKVPVTWSPEPQPQQPSPEEVLAQAQAEKVKIDANLAVREMDLKFQAENMKHEREMAKMQQDAFLKAKEMEMKYAAKADEIEIQAAQARNQDQGGSDVNGS